MVAASPVLADLKTTAWSCFESLGSSAATARADCSASATTAAMPRRQCLELVICSSLPDVRSSLPVWLAHPVELRARLTSRRLRSSRPASVWLTVYCASAARQLDRLAVKNQGNEPLRRQQSLRD